MARYLQAENIRLVLSSPLRRALETATVLCRSWGAEHEVWRDLLEHRRNEPYRFLGSTGVTATCPSAWCEADLPPEGFDFGLETLESGHDRAKALLKRLTERFGNEEKLAVVAHARINSSLLMAALGTCRTTDRTIAQNNGCINQLWMNEREVRLITVNETRHLA